MNFKTYNEDCLRTMGRMKNNSIDMVITSPPYDSMRAYNGFCFDFEKTANELFRVIMGGGVLIWVVSDQVKKGSESGYSFRQALYFKQIGFNINDTMIYAKKNFIPQSHKRYEQCFEYMFCLTKGTPKTFTPKMIESKYAGLSKNFARAGYKRDISGGSQRRRDETITVKNKKVHSNIFYYSTGLNRTGHPAPFPEQLVVDQILTFTKKGDIVYDPFMGSGTTRKVCRDLGRNCIGSEISKEYINMEFHRLNK